MAGYFLLSAKARDFTLGDVEQMSLAQVHLAFVRCRWGDQGTQVCPECGTTAKHYWIKTRKQWRCRELACSRSYSVTSGTEFADYKLPLKTILRAALIFVANVKVRPPPARAAGQSSEPVLVSYNLDGLKAQLAKRMQMRVSQRVCSGSVQDVARFKDAYAAGRHDLRPRASRQLVQKALSELNALGD